MSSSLISGKVVMTEYKIGIQLNLAERSLDKTEDIGSIPILPKESDK